MQPEAALKKVHSLDCGQSQQQVGAAGGAQAGSNRAGAPPLMHSVSIVVELAKEPCSTGSVSLESSLEREDSLRDETPSKEPQPAPPPQQQQHQRQQQYTKEASISPAATTEEEDDDDDDEDAANANDENGDESGEEDDGGCLSSDLARKVVIVDEADKIFLRNRAQSAEPRGSRDLGEPLARRPSVHHASCGGGGDDDDEDLSAALRATLGRSSPAATPPSASPNAAAATPPARIPAAVTALATHTLGRDYFGGRQQHRLSLAAATSGGQATNFSIGGSSGELAERGELSKLGMRRNTHHHVNFNPSLGFGGGTGGGGAGAGGPMRSAINHPGRQHARSGSAQLEHYAVGQLVEAHGALSGARAPLGGGGGGGLLVEAASHKRQPATGACSPLLLPPLSPSKQLALSPTTAKNWSQRRQSLQISLLTGGCCSPVKSLTEEELRGEREFNEQVRNSKSPDVFAYRASSGHQAQQSQLAKATLQQQQQRCQSVAGGSVSEIAGFAEFQAELRQRQQQQQAVGRGNCPFAGAQSLAPAEQQAAAPAATSPLLQQQRQRSQQRQQQSQRRVSFSSIDPILARAESQQQQPARQGRASFAFYPLPHCSPAFGATTATLATTVAHSQDNTTPLSPSPPTTTTTQILAQARSNPSRLAGGSSPDTASSVSAATAAALTTATAGANSSLQVTSGAKGGLASSSQLGDGGQAASRSAATSTAAAAPERTSCMTLDKQKRHSLATTSAARALASLADRAASATDAAAVVAAAVATKTTSADSGAGALASSIFAGISNLAQHQERQQQQQQQQQQLLQETRELIGERAKEPPLSPPSSSSLSHHIGDFKFAGVALLLSDHAAGATKLISPPRGEAAPSALSSSQSLSAAPQAKAPERTLERELEQRLERTPSRREEEEETKPPLLPFTYSPSGVASRDLKQTSAAAAASAASTSTASKMNDNDSFVTTKDAANRVESSAARPIVEPKVEQFAQVKGVQLGQGTNATATTTTTTTTTTTMASVVATESNITGDSERKITSTSPASASGGIERTQVVTSHQAQETKEDGNRVQSIMANARLRQEEFARLLEEHEQIVNEINRVETKISSSQTNLQQQRQQQEESKQ